MNVYKRSFRILTVGRVNHLFRWFWPLLFFLLHVRRGFVHQFPCVGKETKVIAVVNFWDANDLRRRSLGLFVICPSESCVCVSRAGCCVETTRLWSSGHEHSAPGPLFPAQNNLQRRILLMTNQSANRTWWRIFGRPICWFGRCRWNRPSS